MVCAITVMRNINPTIAVRVYSICCWAMMSMMTIKILLTKKISKQPLKLMGTFLASIALYLAFHVYVGNGNKLTSQLHSPKVEIQIQGYKFLLDLFALPMEGLDIFLGVQWLLEFGEVCHNYITQTLVFDKTGETVTLMGDKSLRVVPVPSEFSGHGKFKLYSPII